MDAIVIHTDGCCLGNGQANSIAQAGYGIHVPNFPLGWDAGSPPMLTQKATYQRAELTAVIRALQLVEVRGFNVKRARIYKDSNYAVQGLNEWIPQWRVRDYRTSKRKGVGNADLSKDLDSEDSALEKNGRLVTLDYLPREENGAADALSKSSVKSAGRSKVVKTENVKTYVTSGINNSGPQDEPFVALSEKSPHDSKQLTQWTPDGECWANSGSV